MRSIFVPWPCLQWFCLKSFIRSRRFWWILLDFLCSPACHVQMKAVSFLPSRQTCFQPCPSPSTLAGPPVQYWPARVGVGAHCPSQQVPSAGDVPDRPIPGWRVLLLCLLCWNLLSWIAVKCHPVFSLHLLKKSYFPPWFLKYGKLIDFHMLTFVSLNSTLGSWSPPRSVMVY